MKRHFSTCKCNREIFCILYCVAAIVCILVVTLSKIFNFVLLHPLLSRSRLNGVKKITIRNPVISKINRPNHTRIRAMTIVTLCKYKRMVSVSLLVEMRIVTVSSVMDFSEINLLQTAMLSVIDILVTVVLNRKIYIKTSEEDFTFNTWQDFK